MSAPTWLPPLNSHENYVISTRIDGAKEIIRYPENRGPKLLFCILVEVKVIFYKENDNLGFSGLLLDEVFSVPSPTMDDFTLPICKFLEEVTENLLATRMNIPFELYPLYFLESDNEYSLQDKHGLMHKLESVLSSIMCKCKSNSDIAAIRWEIVKNVTISADEYDAWTSWYAEKSRADPNFIWEFVKAITRPRTTEELLYEELMKSKGATESSIQGLEEEIMAENLNSTSNCSVCLEDVSPGSAAIRLPCSHIFHRDCIVKWLKESHMCPLCRFTLPTSEK